MRFGSSPVPVPLQAALSLSPGSQSPAFSAVVTIRTADVPLVARRVTVTVTAAGSGSTAQANAVAAQGGPADVAQTGAVTTTLVPVLSAVGSAQSDRIVSTATPSVSGKASDEGKGDPLGISVSLSDNTLAGAASNKASNATGGGNQADNTDSGIGALYLFQ